MRLLRLRKDRRTGSISRDVVNFLSGLCRHRSDTLTQVARLVPPGRSGLSGQAGRQADRQTDTSDVFLVAPYVRASHVGGLWGVIIVHSQCKEQCLSKGVTSTNKSTYMRSTYLRDF